jgi:hypothetical protein
MCPHTPIYVPSYSYIVGGRQHGQGGAGQHSERHANGASVTPPHTHSKNQKNLVGGSIHSNAVSLASVTTPPPLATPTPIALGSSPPLALGGWGGVSRSGEGAYVSQTLIEGGKALATHVPTPASPAAGASAATPATPASPALPTFAPPEYRATCMLGGTLLAVLVQRTNTDAEDAGRVARRR